MKLLLYSRVSTQRQSDEGHSLEAQEARLRAYAACYNHEIVDVVTDAGYSAGTLKRPGIARVLAMLESKQADGILVVSLSRLTRSTKDLGVLLETVFRPGGAALVSLGESIDTSSASGRLVANVLGAVLAWEREAAGERTAEVKAHERSKGKFLGGLAPFGFRRDEDRLIPVPNEQAAIFAAREAQARGLTLRAISNELAMRNMLARNGRAFQPTQVARMLETADAIKKGEAA